MGSDPEVSVWEVATPPGTGGRREETVPRQQQTKLPCSLGGARPHRGLEADLRRVGSNPRGRRCPERPERELTPASPVLLPPLGSAQPWPSGPGGGSWQSQQCSLEGQATCEAERGRSEARTWEKQANDQKGSQRRSKTRRLTAGNQNGNGFLRKLFVGYTFTLRAKFSLSVPWTGSIPLPCAELDSHRQPLRGGQPVLLVELILVTRICFTQLLSNAWKPVLSLCQYHGKHLWEIASIKWLDTQSQVMTPVKSRQSATKSFSLEIRENCMIILRRFVWLWISMVTGGRVGEMFRSN